MADAAPQGDGIDRLAGQLGWRARHRAAPFLSHALGAGGGALLAVGVVVLGIHFGEDDNSGTPGAVLSAALVIAALVLMSRLPAAARSACIAAIVIGVPSTWFFLITVESSTASTTGAQLLSAGVLLVLFLFGPTRGRAVLLGASLLFAANLVVGEIGGVNELGAFDDQSSFGDEDFDTGFEEDKEFPEGESDAGVAALVIGGGYLAAAWALDKRGLRGGATPFVAVGIFAAVSGAIIVGVDAGAVGGGLLAVAVGVGVGWVGAQGHHRRASVWLGAITGTVGITVVVNDIADVDDSALGFAILALLLGAAIVVGSVFLGPALGEPDEQPEEEAAASAP